MRLHRPYTPLDVRVAVARRQAIAAGVYPRYDISAWPLSKQLRYLLFKLFGDDRPQLDHQPALCNRVKVNEVYHPPANDPDYLVYRLDHDIKTRVRGDGAQYSDLALLRKNKRIANKDRPIKKIPSRPFATRRKDHGV